MKEEEIRWREGMDRIFTIYGFNYIFTVRMIRLLIWTIMKLICYFQNEATEKFLIKI